MRDPEILRWWKRRFDLFERFDEGIQMDRGRPFLHAPLTCLPSRVMVQCDAGRDCT